MGKGKNLAYVRCSTKEQNEDRQIEALQKYKIDKWFIEKISGKDTNRPELLKMLEFVREDDVVYVEELSRLGRSTVDLLNIVQKIEEEGAKFKSIKENIDTATETGKFFLRIMASIAEFERAMILERQREGIEIAKRKGKYKGRKRIATPDIGSFYESYMKREKNKVEISKELGISRATLDRRFEEYKSSSAGNIEQEQKE